MPDFSPGGKKRKITIVASQEGIKRAEKALIRLGFDSKSNFAKSQRLSRSTVTNFFIQKPIQVDSFRIICEALKLNWQEIVELPSEDTQERIEERQLESSLDTGGAKPVPITLITRKVTVIDEQGQEIKTATVILDGEISSVQADLLFFQDYFSKKYLGSTLKVISLKQGSIKLIIEGTQKDIEMLLSDFESGKLKKVEGFPVKDVQLLSESEAEDERSEQKWRLVEELVEEIYTDPIQGRDLSGADLSDADLSRAYLIGADLRNADLNGADLSRARLRIADLRNADLSGADLSGADLSGAKLFATDLSGAYLASARLIFTDLSGANLSDANLSGAYLIGANLSGADLSGADLSGALINTKTKIDRKWRLVWEIVNQEAKGQNLRNAYLSGADLRDAYLRDVYLRDVYLRDADLRDADLRGADLRNAYLSGADLSGADLRNADLRNADLRNAKVNGARFGNNPGISQPLKQDLIQRGAIFDDSPGDHSEVLVPR